MFKRLAQLPTRTLALWISLALVAGMALGVGTQGERVTAVRVTLCAGAEEPGDGILGRDAPDYRLDLRGLDLHGEGDWLDCGTYEDRPVGDGLVWEVPVPMPLAALAELRLTEVDALDDDRLEELVLDGRVVVGRAFRFELETSFDLGLAVGQFLGTPLGMALAFGIVVSLATLAFTVLVRAGAD